MDDPFLLAHLIRPFFFDIGGKLSPVSIRDQMIRGRMIVDRAYERGIITPLPPGTEAGDEPGSTPNELLVIGAGAAGVTAALRAAELGVKATLVDSAAAAFTRQGGCRSRWVNPTQYDWPANHWGKGHYHWITPAMPLPWRAERSHLIAAGWRTLFNAARLHYWGLLTVLFRTYADNFVAASPGAPPPRLRADLLESKTGRPRWRGAAFGMVVSCVGFGTEKSTVPDDVHGMKHFYRGFSFWETDRFEETDLGTGDPSPNVLISGGGDGGLQDFIRTVTTKKAAEEVYASLPPHARRLLEAALYSAEDQAQRAYPWGHADSQDHHVVGGLHASHEKALDELWNSTSLMPALAQLLDGLIRDEVKTGDLSVTLAHRCSHFGNCYGMNRLLVLMLNRHLKEQYGVSALRPNTVVLKVRGATHHCAGVPATCHGKWHEVTFGQSDCGTRRGAEKPVGPPEDFNVVVIRHGIEPPAFYFAFGTRKFTRKSNPRQILPYHAAS